MSIKKDCVNSEYILTYSVFLVHDQVIVTGDKW